MLERPLLWSTAAFAAGILLPGSDPPPACWAACAAAALGGALALCLAGTSRRTPGEAGLWVVVGFLCAGRLAALACGPREPYDIATLVSRHPESFASGVDLEGRLAREPRPAGRAPFAGHAAGEEIQMDLLLDLDRVTIARIRIPARGRVRLRLPAGGAGGHTVTRLRRGMLVELFARLTAPRRYGNEGAFDYPRYLRARGIEAIGSIKSARMVRAREPASLAPGTRLMRRVDRLRAALLARIDRAFPEDPRGRRAAAVASALLLGDRGGLSLEDEGLLQESGLSHLLAVSGFNVAVLAVSLLLLCRCVMLSTRISAIAVIPCLGLYLLINRDESSVVRAVIMAVAALAARAIWRKPDPLNILALSALAILVPSPLQMFDSGFQLTFAATISLIILVPRFLGKPGRRRGPRARVAWWLRSAVVVTLAVWIGTFPITLLDFNRIAPGALPANLVAGPLMAAAFLGVLALEAAATVSGSIAAALGRLVEPLVDATFRTAEAARSMPFLSYRRVSPDPPTLLLYYGSLCLALLLRGGGRVMALARLVTVSLIVCPGLVMLAPIDTRGRPEGLRVTALDVGQGDSVLVETPSGVRILVDAGGFSRSEFDVGERVVSTALWRLGISRLDYVAVTHADTDHAGGAAAVVRNFGPRSVWVPAGASVWPGISSVRRLREASRESGVPLRELSAGDGMCLWGACVRILNPPPGAPVDLPDNDLSLVLSVSWRGRCVLLAADAGAGAEEMMISRTGRADVLKVAHHGSATGTTGRFARIVAPKVALISCGSGNRFGHPDPEVVTRLERIGARVCRTDRHGAVTVEMMGPSPGATRLGTSCALHAGAGSLRDRR